MTPLRFLVADSETPDEREVRRGSAGKSAGESYAATLEQMVPGCSIDHAVPADADASPMPVDDIARYDAVFLSGSPLHVYDPTPETERQIAFVACVFTSGTPMFGSCAGLQVAVVAAGGTARAVDDQREVGIARNITPTDAGRHHLLLAGRPPAWDALAIHGDEVATLPDGATLLATSPAARVQAVEIRHDGGIFWGVQYHPELAAGEIAAALRRDADALVDAGLASPEDVEVQATLFDQLHHAPDDRAARWRLGIDDAVAHEDRRRTELRNFIDHLAIPTREKRRSR